jgi:cell division protein FtsB
MTEECIVELAKENGELKATIEAKDQKIEHLNEECRLMTTHYFIIKCLGGLGMA